MTILMGSMTISPLSMMGSSRNAIYLLHKSCQTNCCKNAGTDSPDCPMRQRVELLPLRPGRATKCDCCTDPEPSWELGIRQVVFTGTNNDPFLLNRRL